MDHLESAVSPANKHGVLLEVYLHVSDSILGQLDILHGGEARIPEQSHGTWAPFLPGRG